MPRYFPVPGRAEWAVSGLLANLRPMSHTKLCELGSSGVPFCLSLMTLICFISHCILHSKKSHSLKWLTPDLRLQPRGYWQTYFLSVAIVIQGQGFCCQMKRKPPLKCKAKEFPQLSQKCSFIFMDWKPITHPWSQKSSSIFVDAKQTLFI